MLSGLSIHYYNNTCLCYLHAEDIIYTLKASNYEYEIFALVCLLYVLDMSHYVSVYFVKLYDKKWQQLEELKCRSKTLDLSSCLILHCAYGTFLLIL